MKVLIIGASGFVGGHLIDFLVDLSDVDVYATKLINEKILNKNIIDKNIIDLNILDRNEVEEVIERIRPDYIVHLAAQSSVSISWKEPALTYDINVVGTVNLLEAVRKIKISSKILLIGSAEEYGYIDPEKLPVVESTAIEPCNPYAISKAFQEMTASLYVNTYKMDIVMVRAFNHIGPGQSPVFAIPAFARQIAEIEKGKCEPIIYTGNLEAKRDFSDVRDIVRGYWELLKKSKSGEIYNIGSGESFTIESLLNRLISMSSVKIGIRTDPEKVRTVDIPELRADITKIQNDINWQPQIDMDKTLSDTLDYWRAKC